ncbi:hypothetical protein ABT304_29575 [Nocardioides sp. NPDC000445]|uniref:hypothetical protein n=1 Tax=Nocardioides sp. NPDC000445 TaxID=3154257 RepID=UPI003334570E
MKTDSIADLVICWVIAATGFYLAFRWLLGPLAERLPRAVSLVVDAVGAVLLVPEYACTTVLRKAVGRPLPFLFGYGEIVSSLACTLHTAGLVISDAVAFASHETGRTQALAGAVVGALCLVLLT